MPITGNLMRNCRWILRPHSQKNETKYCEKKVKYTIELDPDSGTKIRNYKTFCPKHLKKAETHDSTG